VRVSKWLKDLETMFYGSSLAYDKARPYMHRCPCAHRRMCMLKPTALFFTNFSRSKSCAICLHEQAQLRKGASSSFSVHML